MNDHISGLTLGIIKTTDHVAHVEYYGETLYKRVVTYTAAITWREMSVVPYAGYQEGTQSATGSADNPSQALENAIAVFKEKWKEHPVFKDDNTTV